MGGRALGLRVTIKFPREIKFSLWNGGSKAAKWNSAQPAAQISVLLS